MFFGVVMLLMFMIGARWREDDVPPAGAAGVVSGPKAGAAVASPVSRAWVLVLAAAALLSLPPAWLWQMERVRDRSPDAAG